MNRRKTIERRSSLQRLWSRSPRNRRLKLRRQTPATAAPPGDYSGLLRSVLRAGLITLKTAVALVLIAGVSVGGYYGYRRASTTTYFCVKQIEVRGARRAPTSEIVRLVQSTRGRNIFTVDVGAVGRAVTGHPWVKEARVARELPGRVTIDVVEHRAQALLLLGHLYLVSEEGQVFKRADPDEAQGLAVITGVDRVDYLNDPAAAAWRIRRAMEALRRYYAQVRPALSEVHVGPRDEITLYLRRGGVAVRLGNDPSDRRLGHFDVVWASLGPETSRARVVFLDNEVRADRATVRMGSN